MFPETVIASFTSTVAYDVVVNADMLKDASGGSGVIKAVAWSSQSSTSKFGGFYVEDFNGTSVTIPLQTNGIQPDIVLSYNNGAGISDPYQVLIVYCVGQRAYLDIYDLQDVGLSTFNIPTTPSFSTILSTVCDGFPHIDMFSDISSIPTGCMSCVAVEHFGIVWAANGTANLMGYFADVNTPTSSAIALGSDAFMPDIAGQKDYATGLYRAQIAYASATSLAGGAGSGAVTTTGGLMYMEWDVLSNTALTNTLLQAGQFYYPRIEAMGRYDNETMPLHVKYEIAVVKDKGTTNHEQVWGFNNVTGGSNLSAPQFPAATDYVMSPCVAVGITVQGTPAAHIGNGQYTVGMYPWSTTSLYARDIDAVNDTLISPSLWYEVNTDTVSYHWDLNKNMAVTNCSNSGDDIMTAWYNGADVVCKYSQPNTMAFRPAKGNITKAGTHSNINAQIAGDNLQISGNSVNASYIVRDMGGKLILRGSLPSDGVLSMQELAAGTYILSIKEANNAQYRTKFSKQ